MDPRGASPKHVFSETEYVLLIFIEVKPHVLLRDLDRIHVITLLEFTKQMLIPVTNVGPTSHNLRLSCQVVSKS
jgi:hypothetical protein